MEKKKVMGYISGTRTNITLANLVRTCLMGKVTSRPNNFIIGESLNKAEEKEKAVIGTILLNLCILVIFRITVRLETAK